MDAWSPVLAQFQDRADVRDAVDDVAHVVVAQPVFRHHEAQVARVRCFPGVQRSLEVGQILFRRGHGFRLVAHGDVHHPVRHLYVHGAHFLRLEDA